MIIYINVYIYIYVVINNITSGFPGPGTESPQLWTPTVPVSVDASHCSRRTLPTPSSTSAAVKRPPLSSSWCYPSPPRS